MLVPSKASSTAVTACTCMTADAWVTVLWQGTSRSCYAGHSLHGFTARAEESKAVCAVLVETKQSKCTSAAQSLQTQVQTSIGMKGSTNPTSEVAHRH